MTPSFCVWFGAAAIFSSLTSTPALSLTAPHHISRLENKTETMSVRARLLAMKKAKEDQKAKEEEDKRSIVAPKKKQNVFFKAESPRSRPKQLEVAADMLSRVNEDEIKKSKPRKSWAPKSQPTDRRKMLLRSQTEKLQVEEDVDDNDGEPKVMTHFTRPSIKKGRRTSRMTKRVINNDQESMKKVLPSSPDTKRHTHYRIRTLSSQNLLMAGLKEEEEEEQISTTLTETGEVEEVGEAGGEVGGEAGGEAGGDAGGEAGEAGEAGEEQDVALGIDAYDETVPEWHYVDDENVVQGPYDGRTVASWVRMQSISLFFFFLL